jgi:signal transduction histidine kinase/DNA-binding response OmpR family regulator
MSMGVVSAHVRYEQDVVAARQRAREIAGLVGFDLQDQTRIATAVSEIARNAVGYGGGGKVEFAIEGRTAPQVLVIRVTDSGPGIADLPAILAGRYSSPTGMGLGIVGAQRLMDHFHIESQPGGGTVVVLKKLFPARAPLLTGEGLVEIARVLARQQPLTALDEVQRQNQELLRTLDQLRERQEELGRLNAELDDTNRGVVALYAELDEKADHLRRADEMKSRFLSNMSHEFRTPLNSILALSQLLLSRADGPVTEEQEKQLAFIRKSAEDLSELVNDLLDLAKVEAGKIVVRPIRFEVQGLFAALRGMLRPLLVSDTVQLVFEDPQGVPPLYTDEAKISQILRNFVSNALKFTERGEVRISARLAPSGDAVDFSVADTGIGIAFEDQERIFQEFTQLEHPLQRQVKGTGLGLPLCRRLAELLGGALSVTSTPGAGATFSAILPLVYSPPAAATRALAPEPLEAGGVPVLVVEDSPETILLYEKFLKRTAFQVIPAATLWDARRVLSRLRPEAIVLDIVLKGEDTWAFLAELRRQAPTRDIPIVVVSTLDDQHKGLGLGADAYGVKPVERRWLVETLEALTRREGGGVLIVDDTEVDRYVLRGLIAGTGHAIIEAASGGEGLARARAERPAAIVLDLMMPDMSGWDFLDALRADPAIRHIPVIVATSSVLDADDHGRLADRAVAVVSKETHSREAAVTTMRQALARAGLVTAG